MYQGKALNKPILLLSVIELITQGIIKDKYIPISDELIDTFKKYWSVLDSGNFKSSDFALPFFHLKNEDCRFWKLEFSSNYEGGRPQSIPKLRHDVDRACLDDELFNLLEDEVYKQELIDTLVAIWFSANKKQLEDILQVNQDFQESTQQEVKILRESENLDGEPKIYLKKSIVRNAFFRKAVVHIYNYRCAFCGLKVIKKLNQSIVDGAHIRPFSLFYDSQVDNGISFCKNHHWAFDHGWFGIDKNYKIIVAGDLQEESPHAKPMKDFHGETLLLPNSEKYYPRMEAIQWHHQNVFRT
ncbi:HNH endonuclease [Lyngbya aestuarii]|uniref:HNH endonuclease n=1 Tax=Lyngbya aestuarii TaxID=118322 RepID=UPI00403D7F60